MNLKEMHNKAYDEICDSGRIPSTFLTGLDTYEQILRITNPETSHPRRYPWWQYPYRLFIYLRLKYVFYPRLPEHARREVERAASE